MTKVIVGLSGGVDSSVAALLLIEQGYEVEALFMRNWDSATNNDLFGNPLLANEICPQEQDFLDALQVANQLNIVLHRVDFIQEYWDDVFSYFLEEHKRGRTPNPDILCNKYIKFKAFLEEAIKLGADYIAMGHYARVSHEKEEVSLLRGVDSNKDQTYFLSQLTQDQLKRSLFPIGHLPKSEVRKLALKNNISTATKKDSTGICFIGERHFQAFLSNYLPAMPGDIYSDSGEFIGKHEGLMNYTIGQRKGLGIGGSKEYTNEPWYVIGKDLTNNSLIVGQGFHHPLLYSTRCTVEDVNWIPQQRFVGNFSCSAKFRYRQSDIFVTISWTGNNSLEVVFQEPVRAITPGQAAVFYHNEICLGGGTINAAYDNDTLRNY